MRLLFIISCIFFYFVLVYGQPMVDEDLIEWNSENKLRWSYFKANKKSTSLLNARAHCNSRYNYMFFLRNDSLYFSIVSVFIQSGSWKERDFLLNDYDLQHEQRHFDITELFARYIRKDIIEKRLNEKEISVLLKQKNIECDKFQKLYDEETDHSLNYESQEKWNQKIDSLLNLLDAYKDKIIYIENPWCKICWDATSGNVSE